MVRLKATASLQNPMSANRRSLELFPRPKTRSSLWSTQTYISTHCSHQERDLISSSPSWSIPYRLVMAALRGNIALTTAARAAVHRHSSRSFSSCRTLRSYDDTVQNLRIGKHTRVIYQVYETLVLSANRIKSNSRFDRDSPEGLLPEMLRTAWSTVPTS